MSDALTKAFAVADAIAALDIESHYRYLTLVQLGGGEYAATFDTVLEADIDDWYEDYSLSDYPHSARTSNPATAIMEAAVKLIEDLQLGIPV